jgi:RNA polymerase sigma-70 factor (ECF subfamily)
MNSESAQLDGSSLFEQAALAHSPRLLTIAKSIVGSRAAPEDVVQQALTNLFEHRARYDWNESGPLLRRAVVNEALRMLRHQPTGAISEDHPGNLATPIRGLLDRETIQQVRAAIERLPNHYRDALVLCEYEGMAYSEIAELLDATVPQVKTWLHRARQQLARLLCQFIEPSTFCRSGVSNPRQLCALQANVY